MIAKLIKQPAELHGKAEILTSCLGVGVATASVLMAELPELWPGP